MTKIETSGVSSYRVEDPNTGSSTVMYNVKTICKDDKHIFLYRENGALLAIVPDYCTIISDLDKHNTHNSKFAKGGVITDKQADINVSDIVQINSVEDKNLIFRVRALNGKKAECVVVNDGCGYSLYAYVHDLTKIWPRSLEVSSAIN